MFNNAILTDANEQPDKLRAQAILKGYEQIGCHAVNVGGFELAAGTTYLPVSYTHLTLPTNREV